MDIEKIATLFGSSETGFVFFETVQKAGSRRQIKIVAINPAAAKIFSVLGAPQKEIQKQFSTIPPGEGHRTIVEKNGYHIRLELLKRSEELPRLRILLVYDISEQVQLENHKSILTHALNSVQDAVYVIDRDGREIFHNPRIKRFTPPHREKLLSELNAVFKTGRRVEDSYLVYKTVDNEPVHILASYFPVRKNKKTTAVVSINKFVTEIQKWFRKAINLQNQLEEYNLQSYRRQNGTRYTFDDIIGENQELKSICDTAQKAAHNYFPVLIQGETGVGKEMFAQSIHNESPNSEKPFVAVVCSAIPESLLESTLFGTRKGAFTDSDDTIGLFEQAGEGTLFLDEINSIPLHLQSKLLRTLEEKRIRRVGGHAERPIRCRIISATNEDTMRLIEQGRLREDFFYRLAGVVLTIPPLRKRTGDILLLTQHFLKRMNSLYGIRINEISPELGRVLKNHQWPGNVRELSHIIEGSVHLLGNAPILGVEHLPDYFQPKALKSRDIELLNHGQEGPLPERLKKMERKWILDSLKKNNGNISKSAETLGIKRQNLQARLKKLAISRKLLFYVD